MDEPSHYMYPIIQRLEDMGRVKERLDKLLEFEIFDDLSKHNTYFHSEHPLEEDKLYDLRCKLCAIQDSLKEINSILYKD